jgi:Membrane protein involved in the export of O-antigen and teichoic acid
MLSKSGNIRKLIKSGGEHAAYVVAMLFSAFAHFVYSIYVKRTIEPLEFGIYSTCLLLQTYLTYIQLGVMNSFNRDYPQLIGAGNKEKAEVYRNTSFTYLLVVFGIAQLLITIGFAVFGTIFQMDRRYSIGFILCSLITFVTLIENFGCYRVRIDGSFNYTSIVTVLETISVGIGLLLVHFIGYYALYFTTILNMLIGIGLYFKKGYKDIKLRVDWPLLKIIVVSGLPLLVNSLIWTVVNSIDKIVILSRINTEALGIYSIAQMAFSYVVLVPNAMSQLFYVKMGKVYGATNDVKKLASTAEEYTKILAAIVSVIVLFAFYFIGPLVEWIMPNYSGGTRSGQILMLGLAIYAPTMVNSNILTILKKNAALLRGSIYLCILNFVLSFGFVFLFGAKIENVALGTSISYLIRTVILLIQLKNYADISLISMFKASILAVISIITPGVILFYSIEGLFLSFIFSIVIALTVLSIMFKDFLKNLLRGEK